jgi:predicted nucleic acid-binding protein
MIAAAALHAGCDTLWSEDMQHGITLEEGLRIVNPFRVASSFSKSPHQIGR